MAAFVVVVVVIGLGVVVGVAVSRRRTTGAASTDTATGLAHRHPGRHESWSTVLPPAPAPRATSPPDKARGGTRGPLATVSAVERRGQMAKLVAVSFVDGEPASEQGGGEATAASSVTGDADAPPADRALRDDLVQARRLRTECQIMRVERMGPGTLVDLVTLGPGQLGAATVPAGTPLALGFGPEPPGAECQDLRAVMGYWEAIGVVVDLDVVETPHTTRYRFASADDGLALLVEADRS